MIKEEFEKEVLLLIEEVLYENNTDRLGVKNVWN